MSISGVNFGAPWAQSQREVPFGNYEDINIFRVAIGPLERADISFSRMCAGFH